jgi:hypothetical protein
LGGDFYLLLVICESYVLSLSLSLPHSSLHRPLLVILDRGIDLATPMHHTWTYQALVHDILVRTCTNH